MFFPYARLLDLSLLDLTSGKSKDMQFPQYGFTPISKGAFSPDDRYFAFSASYQSNALHLLNLKTGQDSIIFRGSCDRYTNQINTVTEPVCGNIDDPIWLDNTTLVFSAYTGIMPEMLKLGDQIKPDTTYVLNLDGAIWPISPALYIRQVFGNTLLYYEYGKSKDGYKWLDTNEMKKGLIIPHLFKVDSTYLESTEYPDPPSISPDGQFAFTRIHGAWHLFNLRGGSDTKIANTGVGECWDLLWSPNQKYLFCGSEYTVISLEGYADQKIPYLKGFVPFIWLP